MKIEDILNNQDYMNISRKASGSFRGSLSSDEILYCTTNAAWNAVKSYDPKKSKLVTFFYRGVRIECLKKIKENKEKNKFNVLEKDVPEHKSAIDTVDMLDEIKNCKDPDIMYDRFYNNKTLREIAKGKSLTKEAVRLRIQKNLKIIKSRIDSCV
jgi:hypothetical protein